MRGLRNHSFILPKSSDETSRFVCHARTKDCFHMWVSSVARTCDHPALTPYVDPNSQISSILGEVWEVDETVLSRLDDLEGHPDWCVQ